jgi:hypothetical protein
MLPQARHTSRVTRDLHQKFRLGKKISRNVHRRRRPHQHIYFLKQDLAFFYTQRGILTAQYTRNRDFVRGSKRRVKLGISALILEHLPIEAPIS